MKTKKREAKKSTDGFDALRPFPDVTPEAEALLTWLLRHEVVRITPGGAVFLEEVQAEHKRRRESASVAGENSSVSAL